MFLIRIPENARFHGTINGTIGRFERTPMGVMKLPNKPMANEFPDLHLPFLFLRYAQMLGVECVDYQRE